MDTAIYTTAIAGFVLSLYTLYIEYQLKKNTSYKAVCDINDRMSCTRTFSSGYGKMFGISNAYPGFLFYLVVIGLTYYAQFDFLLYVTVFGVLFSAYLAYLLYFKLKHFCLVCNGIYLVNILLLIFVWMHR